MALSILLYQSLIMRSFASGEAIIACVAWATSLSRHSAMAEMMIARAIVTAKPSPSRLPMGRLRRIFMAGLRSGGEPLDETHFLARHHAVDVDQDQHALVDRAQADDVFR